MSNYQRAIDGNLSFDQITLQVRGEEAGASQFLDSVVSSGSGKPINLATFKALPAGTVPKNITFCRPDASTPAGAESVWTGTMVVSGQTQSAKAYRDP